MKRIYLFYFIAAGLLLSLTACSSEDPQFRIHNERADKANVQLQTSGGNTININDVEAGQTTAYQSVSEGYIVVTAVIKNASVSPTAKFFCGRDVKYTVVVQSGTVATLRLD